MRIVTFTLHTEKIIQNTVIKMERELIKKEQDMAKQYWDMVSLLTTVLNHNQLVEVGYQDDISFYTKQISSITEKYPQYAITDEVNYVCSSSRTVLLYWNIKMD